MKLSTIHQTLNYPSRRPVVLRAGHPLLTGSELPGTALCGAGPQELPVVDVCGQEGSP